MSENGKIAQELGELRVELKYMSRTLDKMEKVFEGFSTLIEKQNVANKRILNLENADRKQDELFEEKVKEIEGRIRDLEDWKIKIITIATIIATGLGFILNKIF